MNSVVPRWPEHIEAGVRKWSTRRVSGYAEGEFHHVLGPGDWRYWPILVSKGCRCHEKQYGHH